jgi:hypothetical protein
MATEYENSQKLAALTETFEQLFIADEDTDVTYDETTKPSFDKRFKQIVDDYGNIVDLTAAAEAAAESAIGSAGAAAGVANQYDSTADALSNGLKTVAITGAGSGGTDGTYVVDVTGSTGSNGKILVVISGGVLTEASILVPGKDYTGTAVADIDSAAGTTGATVSIAIAANRGVGEYFTIPSGVANGALDIYVVETGPVATFTDLTLIDGVAVSEIEAVYGRQSDDNALVIENQYGQKIAILDQQGRLKLTALSVAGVDITEGGGGEEDSEYSPPLIYSDLLALISYGQSLSIGAEGFPAITTTQRFDSLRFNVGIRPEMGGLSVEDSHATLVALTENVNANYGETPCSGAAECVIELLVAEDGRTYGNKGFKFLAAANGRGGTSIAGLSPDGEYYQRIVDSLDYGAQRADELGLAFDLPAVLWTQGEADDNGSTTIENYLASLSALRAQIDIDAATYTGLTYQRGMIGYQVSSHNYYDEQDPKIALAHLAAHKAKDGFFIATPSYIFDYAVDGLHLTAESYKWMGAYYGLAYKRVFFDRVGWECLRPLSWVIQGKYVIAKFATDTQLVLDTTLVSAADDYGFDAVDEVGDPLAISSVSVVGNDKVKFTFATDFPSGGHIRAGFNGTPGNLSGPVTGARTNLRDSLGDSIIFDTAGINKPLHRWCVFFDEEIV